MRAGMVLIASCLLTACSSASDDRAISDGQDSSAQTSKYLDAGKQAAWNDAGQEAIKAKLRDPESAQFRDVAFHSGSGTPITCGEVNSKNGFGGYSGFERFIAAGDVLTVIESEMADGEMDKLWDKFCV